MQIIAVFIIVCALLITDIADPLSPAFWIMAFSTLVAVLGINIMVMSIATEPLKQLVAALAKTQGESSPLLPPNPNAKRYEKSGLRKVLLTVYELSVDKPVDSPTIDTSAIAATPAGLVDDAVSSTSFGMAILDKTGKLIYHNDNAPVHSTPESGDTLELEFYTDQPLEAWIKECEEKAVHAEKTWTRVANKPVGEDDRKIYDMVASYQKGSPAPIVIVFIEKTADYEPEEDDLSFIAFAAHELRGPITVIRGYLDTLNDEMAGSIDAEQQQLFERLIVSANRLSSYVNNILNSARYDRRHLSIHLIETSVNDIYQMIADDMQLRATSQQRLLTVNFPTDLPTVAADPASASEVFGNLIDNAIKYSNEGGIVEVSAEIKDSFVQVSVRDHGIGMPANVVSNLFHKFYRSHRSRETVAGTGIGLYISKAIIESHGGTMEVSSVEGAGSTFSFTLPVYSTVAEKLAKTGGDNRNFIEHKTGSWIRNHGTIRG